MIKSRVMKLLNSRLKYCLLPSCFDDIRIYVLHFSFLTCCHNNHFHVFYLDYVPKQDLHLIFYETLYEILFSAWQNAEQNYQHNAMARPINN